MAILAFRCGACGQVVAVAESYRGREARCGSCGQNMRVPEQAPALEVASISEELSLGASASPTPPAQGLGTSLLPTTQEVALPTPSGDKPEANDGLGESEASAVAALAEQDRTSQVSPTELQPRERDGASVAVIAEAPAGPSSMEAASPWTAPGAETVSVEPRRAWPVVEARRRRIPISFWLLAVLIPTTVTFLAISVILFRLWLAEMAKKERHPLEDLPEALEGTADVGGRPRLVINPIQSPPEGAIVRLGETKRYDGIEVTPISVRWQQVIYARTQDGRTHVRHPDRMLVLHLRLRNVSDHIIQPFEPIYNAAFQEGRAVYTYLSVGEERYYGPVMDVALERIEGQVFTELWPVAKQESEPESNSSSAEKAAAASELETLVLAYQSPKKRKISEALAGLPSTTVLRWHVHLRKGRQDRLIKGRGYRLWLTTVVPVEFEVAQIGKEAP